MSDRAPRLLFAPASGPGGSGEYYRALALARAVADRRPEAAVDFLLHRHAGVERDARFRYHALPATPSRAAEEVASQLERLRPDLAYFDCTGRARHFRQLKRAGARVAWASDRPPKRLRGFRPRQMRWTDLHLVVDVSGQAPRLKWYERALMKLFSGCRVELVRGIVAEPDPAALEAVRDRLPPAGAPCAVFVAGGGGYEHAGRPVPEILLEAAERLRVASGLDCVVVMGPQYRGACRQHADIHMIDALPTQGLGALLGGAAVVISGAGSMLSAQVMSAGRPAVMFPAGGNDQAGRIRDLSSAGLVAGAALDAGELAAKAAAVLDDKAGQARMVERQKALGLGEATGRIAERLLAMAEQK